MIIPNPGHESGRDLFFTSHDYLPMSRWLLIDGFNLAYRCFFATPALSRADGFPTNALHGWIKSVWRLIDQEKPDHTVVFFDLGGSQDRLALHPDYKAQRAEMPPELSLQIPYVKTVTRALGLVAVEQDGVESDDLLATCAVACASRKRGKRSKSGFSSRTMLMGCPASVNSIGPT